MTITIEDFIVAFGSDDIPLTPDGQPDQAKVDWSINAALGTAHAYLLAVGLSAYDQKVQASIKLRILDLVRYELNPDHVTDLIKERKATQSSFSVTFPPAKQSSSLKLAKARKTAAFAT